jgi:hypothetical protein
MLFNIAEELRAQMISINLFIGHDIHFKSTILCLRLSGLTWLYYTRFVLRHLFYFERG